MKKYTLLANVTLNRDHRASKGDVVELEEKDAESLFESGLIEEAAADAVVTPRGDAPVTPSAVATEPPAESIVGGEGPRGSATPAAPVAPTGPHFPTPAESGDFVAPGAGESDADTDTNQGSSAQEPAKPAPGTEL
jgi:hypothetical protein